MTHQSLFNSIGNNLLFILSIQTSLAIFCWQTALVDLISGHYQCSSDRGESVLLPGSSLSATEPIKTHRFLFLPDFQKSVEESLPVRILCKFLNLNTFQTKTLNHYYRVCSIIIRFNLVLSGNYNQAFYGTDFSLDILMKNYKESIYFHQRSYKQKSNLPRYFPHVAFYCPNKTRFPVSVPTNKILLATERNQIRSP